MKKLWSFVAFFAICYTVLSLFNNMTSPNITYEEPTVVKASPSIGQFQDYDGPYVIVGISHGSGGSHYVDYIDNDGFIRSMDTHYVTAPISHLNGKTILECKLYIKDKRGYIRDPLLIE